MLSESLGYFDLAKAASEKAAALFEKLWKIERGQTQLSLKRKS